MNHLSTDLPQSHGLFQDQLPVSSWASSWLQTNLFSTDDLWRLQGINLPSEGTWVLQQVSSSFSSLTWVITWLSATELSLPLSYTPLKQKRAHKTKVLVKLVSLLKYVCAPCPETGLNWSQGIFLRSLLQGPCLQPHPLLSELHQTQASSPITHYQNCTKYKTNTVWHRYCKEKKLVC